MENIQNTNEFSCIRLLSREIYYYFNHWRETEFTYEPLGYYRRQKIKLKLRNNTDLNKLYNCRTITIYNRTVTKYKTEISLAWENQTKIPSAIINFKLLTLLNVNSNRLTSLPSFVCNIKLLKSLDLGGNQLTTLPSAICKLKLLKELYLSANQITILPSSIGNLKYLEQLYLSHNQITTLPSSIGNLKSLKGLYIASNQLTTLPVEMANLKSLIYFHVYSNPLTKLSIYLVPLLSNTPPLTVLPINLDPISHLHAIIFKYHSYTVSSIYLIYFHIKTRIFTQFGLITMIGLIIGSIMVDIKNIICYTYRGLRPL